MIGIPMWCVCKKSHLNWGYAQVRKTDTHHEFPTPKHFAYEILNWGYDIYDIYFDRTSAYQIADQLKQGKAIFPHRPSYLDSTPSTPNDLPEIVVDKPQLILTLGLWGAPKAPNSSEIIKACDLVLQHIGWEAMSCNTTISSISITFEKKGSPILLPVAAILASIMIAVSAIIVSINWKTVRVAEEATKQLVEKSKQLNDISDLTDQLGEDYQNGLIDHGTYQSLLSTLTGAAENVTLPPPSVQSDSMGDMMGMVQIAIPAVLLIALLQGLKK